MEKYGEKLYCYSCKKKTNQAVVYKHSVEGDYETDGYNWSTNYFIVQCLGCDYISFAEENWNESMFRPSKFDENDEPCEWEPYSIVSTYPEQEPSRTNRIELNKKEFFNVPGQLQDLYGQVIHNFNLEYLLFAGIGLRMISEAICKDQKIIDGYVLDNNGNKVMKNGDVVRSQKLVGKINGLVEKHLITPNQADVLHDIREIGNSTAHDIEIPIKKTIRLAIEIIEHIFYTIYELQSPSKISSVKSIPTPNISGVTVVEL
ncbi:DUF4145 domain-containing protein [Brevibacillus brevis]|uniref:DUF4145 domain-containing protein n=1 Tax=Brevibacillus brevis TaxID=1393 RepID=UPI0025A59A75|nr:DUF4145 domain-containing protein [Brevibacillus brevis]WJQ79821.1 DUF4145 domain-containing protein [Brevibacillus brevis]